MTRAFPQSTKPGRQWIALAAASLTACLLFLLIPLTQSLDDSSRDVVTYREMRVAMPPPPPFVPPPPVSEDLEEVFETASPSMEKPLEDIPIQQLELSLSPGMGVPLAMGLPSLPDIGEGDLTAEIERIFNFDELDRVPTLLNARMIRAEFPRDLARKGVRKARVELEILIDKRGRVQVTRILSSTHDHAQLKEAARKAGSQARFSVTKVDGQPVTVRGRFPIALQAPR